MTKEAADETKIALINNNISYIQKDQAEIKTKVTDMARKLDEIGGMFATTNALRQVAVETEQHFSEIDKKMVSQESFLLVQRIVFGFVGLVLLAVVGALISLVVRQ